jgi:flagella basal body P-ring formation protein FlgA
MFHKKIKFYLTMIFICVAVQLVWAGCIFANANEITASDASSISATDIKIVINETSLVSGPDIFLKDIAEISASEIFKQSLETIEIGMSPKPDKLKSFDKKKIILAIKRQKYLPENISISSPARIYVKRSSQKISKDDIRQLIDGKLSLLFQGREYQMKTFNVRGFESYPDGNVEFRLSSGDLVNKKGKLSCSVDIIIDGSKQDRLNVSGEVAVYENILHVAKSYSKGEKIATADVYSEKKNIFNVSGNFIKTYDEIDRLILKSSVRRGECLNSDLFVNPPMVKKGDIIKLVAKQSSLLIVTSGISKENGFANDVIKVENLNSGKLVRGIVKGKSKVEVIY